MNILIDADGCPVVDLTLQIAKQFIVPVIILCDACAIRKRGGVSEIEVAMPRSIASRNCGMLFTRYCRPPMPSETRSHSQIRPLCGVSSGSSRAKPVRWAAFWGWGCASSRW